VERGSDKHGRVHDEQLKQETEGLVRAGHATRAEEFSEEEAPADLQPQPDREPDSRLVGGTPQGVSPQDVEGRAELARWLDGTAFPGDREALLTTAQELNAPDVVRDALAALPAGREFGTVAEVWRALGGHVEEPRS
jgi:hypothetical protein